MHWFLRDAQLLTSRQMKMVLLCVKYNIYVESRLSCCRPIFWREIFVGLLHVARGPTNAQTVYDSSCGIKIIGHFLANEIYYSVLFLHTKKNSNELNGLKVI